MILSILTQPYGIFGYLLKKWNTLFYPNNHYTLIYISTPNILSINQLSTDPPTMFSLPVMHRQVAINFKCRNCGTDTGNDCSKCNTCCSCVVTRKPGAVSSYACHRPEDEFRFEWNLRIGRRIQSESNYCNLCKAKAEEDEPESKEDEPESKEDEPESKEDEPEEDNSHYEYDEEDARNSEKDSDWYDSDSE